MKDKILITGATGNVGTALIKTLKETGGDFVAGVRDVAKAKEKIGDAKAVEFDFANPQTFEGATNGVNKVFLMGPPVNSDLDRLVSPFIDFLKRKKIERVVYLSAFGMEHIQDRLPFHVNVVNKLEKDGFDFTILKPTFFSQNFKNYDAENILQRGITYAPAGTGKVAFVDAHDVARVAAKVLTSDGHSKKSYVLTGPEVNTFEEIAKLLSEVVGKKIVYPNPSPEEFTLALKNAGAPDFIAPFMITVYSNIVNGFANIVMPDVEQLTGRKPASLKTVLARDFSKSVVEA